MNNVDEGIRLLLVVVVALIALAGVVLIRNWLRVVVLLVGVLVILYLLGYVVLPKVY
jgi:hypothetical protein